MTPLRSGTLNLRFRTTLRAGTLGCVFVNDITACDGLPAIDQQGWQAMEFTAVAAIPGDANLDDCVDSLDQQILKNNWGQSGNLTWEDGDFNGDGFIGIEDLSILLSHFGEGC